MPVQQEWFTVYEHNRRAGCTVSDLVMGNEYSFRVFSENICGLSDQAGLSRNTAVIAKTGEERPAAAAAGWRAKPIPAGFAISGWLELNAGRQFKGKWM